MGVGRGDDQVSLDEVLLGPRVESYWVEVLDERDRRGASSVEVRPELVPAFTSEMRDRSERSVWRQGGCTSWYLDDDGENRTLWPGGVGEYEQRLTRPDAIDFLFT